MSKELQRKEALENAEANIQYLASLPDSTLAEKLELVHVQMELAEQKKNVAALELLEIWRSQLIEARICKQEENIADAFDEIAEAIAGIETVTAQLEEREEALSTEEHNEPAKASRRKQATETPQENQLPLF
jgi:hypothetical protein